MSSLSLLPLVYLRAVFVIQFSCFWIVCFLALGLLSCVSGDLLVSSFVFWGFCGVLISLLYCRCVFCTTLDPLQPEVKRLNHAICHCVFSFMISSGLGCLSARSSLPTFVPS